jgi:hypothetical protein
MQHLSRRLGLSRHEPGCLCGAGLLGSLPSEPPFEGVQGRRRGHGSPRPGLDVTDGQARVLSRRARRADARGELVDLLVHERFSPLALVDRVALAAQRQTST